VRKWSQVQLSCTLSCGPLVRRGLTKCARKCPAYINSTQPRVRSTVWPAHTGASQCKCNYTHPLLQTSGHAVQAHSSLLQLFVLYLPNMILLPRNSSLPSFTTKRCRNHFYPGGGTLAITMRLAGSITRPIIKKVQALEAKYGNDIPADVYWSVGAAERDAFRQYARGKTDRRSLNGPFHLHHNDEIRQFIFESILEEER